MSIPPERISIKRRREHDPVETLYLERGNGPEKKRRVTDFYFQRVQSNVILPAARRDTASAQGIWSKPPAPGIPPIRLTSLEKPSNGLSEIQTKPKDEPLKPDSSISSSSANASNTSISATPAINKTPQQVRRFHLARSISSVLSPNASAGIRKPKTFIRPPLATFIERYGVPTNHEQNPIYRSNPVDKMLELPSDANFGGTKTGQIDEPTAEALDTAKRVPVSTFVPSQRSKVRNGTSIKDDPSTWDYESEQLALELEAFAIELDPELQQKLEADRAPTPPAPPPPQDVAMTTYGQDDYVYETYVRVPCDESTDPSVTPHFDYGVLVIDEDVEDLWQKYVDSEEDSDWDEEDSNAEDNPSNEYPEDEVSSDDEYGHDSYKYRNHGSDDEQFDEEDNH